MSPKERMLLDRLRAGRTDLVLDLLDAGHSPHTRDEAGVPLLAWCAYYGDVTALRLLLAKGESLKSLGDDLGLLEAAFHGHWRLSQFLLENGADANTAHPRTGETPLHAALSSHERGGRDLVVELLLDHGADPDRRTRPGAETASFMRDARTRGETPLHRAAAFGSEAVVQRLLDAGADREAKDAQGDTPLSWASWSRRPAPLLRKLVHGPHSIPADYGEGLEANLRGKPL